MGDNIRYHTRGAVSADHVRLFLLPGPPESEKVWIHSSSTKTPGCCNISKLISNTIHYNGVITGAMVSQITSLTIVYSTVYSDEDHGKHQSSASLAFVRGIHRGPVNSPHKWPVTRNILPFDDVIMLPKVFHAFSCSAVSVQETGFLLCDKCQVSYIFLCKISLQYLKFC